MGFFFFFFWVLISCMGPPSNAQVLNRNLSSFKPTPVFLGFPCGSTGKETCCNVRDLASVLGLGRSPGEGKGYPTLVFWPGSQRVGHDCATFTSVHKKKESRKAGPWAIIGVPKVLAKDCDLSSEHKVQASFESIANFRSTIWVV